MYSVIHYSSVSGGLGWSREGGLGNHGFKFRPFKGSFVFASPRRFWVVRMMSNYESKSETLKCLNLYPTNLVVFDC